MAHIERSEVTLPAALRVFVESTHVQSAVEFCVLAGAYPRQLAGELGWEEADVKLAVRRLRKQLAEAGLEVPPASSSSAPPPHSRPLGARHPSSSDPPPLRTGTKHN
jgi:hypothetical protein